MSMIWLFRLSGITVAGFGAALLIAPAIISGIYGLSLGADGEVVARILGAAMLGYLPVDWLAIKGSREVRMLTLRAGLIAEVGGAIAAGVGAIQGRGNTLFLSVPALFAIFAIWRGYHLVTYGRREVGDLASGARARTPSVGSGG
ncbi:MAG TPA: hypothetical protein VM070_08380 [Candidatus Saccharimonadales bacterium]|nr:hypothetical protein [Candidatus Saccharimonadales bacterium]